MRALIVVVMACGGGTGGGSLDAPAGDQVGRVCDLGSAPTDQNVVASPALDCAGRICTHVASATVSLCSAECTTAADCIPHPDSPCTAGFVCEPVVAVGPFACRKLCLCADPAASSGCP